MKAWKYKHLMPTVIGAMFELLDRSDLIDLVSRNFDYIYSILARTSYQIELSRIPSTQINAASIQNALLKNYIRMCGEIEEHSPKDISYLLSTILMKFEADNIKAILRAKSVGISVDEAMKFIVPTGRMDERRCRSVLDNSKHVRDVIELLSDLDYTDSLKEVLEDYEETGNLLLIEASLARSIYKQIYKAIGKVKGRDGKIAQTVLGLEIDSINIRVILRGKSLGIAEDQIRYYLLPASGIIGKKELEIAVKAKDIPSSIESLFTIARYNAVRDYQYMLTALLEEYEDSQSLSRLEIVLDRSLLKTSLRMLQRYTPYFNIGLILAFLNAKWFEVKNLSVIVRGVEAKIPPDRIESLLILPD
jgi:ATP synthase A1 C subunit